MTTHEGIFFYESYENILYDMKKKDFLNITFFFISGIIIYFYFK